MPLLLLVQRIAGSPLLIWFKQILASDRNNCSSKLQAQEVNIDEFQIKQRRIFNKKPIHKYNIIM